MVVAWLTSLVAAIVVGVVIIGLGWWRSKDGGIDDGVVMMVLVMVIAIKGGDDGHGKNGGEAMVTATSR
ncbi:hypothetical protein C1H46_030041 [Malus baccata]|uniref:Uncharacterized protein n=1 Tax=Malus baccata TaxID=106549 RepID=A0A540LD28_MALBA|nr:hypothetical protein C1H46_030041 [Malus baccata]